MELMTIRSGSNANCVYIKKDGYGILIDAGVGPRILAGALRCAGSDISRIAAIFITHEHIDHIRGLETITNRYHIPVFANEATLYAIEARYPGIDSSVFYALPTGANAVCPDLQVTSFKTPHDAVESVGYSVTDGRRTVSVATDLGVMTQTVLNQILTSDAVVLESNYDTDMLVHGAYHPSLKKRILSENGHLSNDECADAAVRLLESGTKTLVLAHLSENNNMPDIAYKTTRRMLEQSGAKIGTDIALVCASRTEASERIAV